MGGELVQVLPDGTEVTPPEGETTELGYTESCCDPTKGVFVTPSESTPAENDPQNRCLVVPADKPIASEPSANARVDSLMKESTTKPSPEFRIPTLGHEYYTVVDRRLASQDVVFTTLP